MPSIVMPSESSVKRGSKTFRPYEKQTLDAPFFHILLLPLLSLVRPVLGYIYAIRWQLSRPLNIRVLPRWVPALNFPVIKDFTNLTIGQILLSIPLAIIFLSGVYATFVSPDQEKSGDIASYAIIATFVTANKANSVISFLFGISFERLIPFHYMSSLLTVLLTFFHVYVAFAYGDRRRLESLDDNDDSSQFRQSGSNPNLMRFLFDGENNTSGSLLMITFLVLVLSSAFPIFRRNFFDLWFWIHITSTICCIIFAVMHEVDAIYYAAAWWLLDILMRYIVMVGCKYPHKAKLELVGDDIVQVSFSQPSGFEYNCGQFVQIAFPDINAIAFHPISISSSPNDDEVTLHVRALGGWSKRLVELAKKKKNEDVSILIEGPYGSLSVDIDDDARFQVALLVSGGIGVTHCQSVARTLLQQSMQGRRLKHLRFVWAIRDLDMMTIMPPLAADGEEGSRDIENLNASLPRTERLSDVSFTPDESSKLATKVQSDIFLTKSTASPPVALDDGRNLYFGRPDIAAIVADVKEEAERQGVTHVAVFGCGPKRMIDQLKDECRIQSQGVLEMDGVTLEMHEEIFDF